MSDQDTKRHTPVENPPPEPPVRSQEEQVERTGRASEVTGQTTKAHHFSLTIDFFSNSPLFLFIYNNHRYCFSINIIYNRKPHSNEY